MNIKKNNNLFKLTSYPSRHDGTKGSVHIVQEKNHKHHRLYQVYVPEMR